MSAQALRPMHALTHPRSASSLSAAVAVSFVAIVPWLLSETWWLEFSIAITLAVAVLAASADAATGRLPDRLVALAAVPTFVVVAAQLVRGAGADTASDVVVGIIAFAGPLLVAHLASPAAMGFGDVKLAAVLGASIGLVDPIAPLLALCLASAITVVVATVRSRTAVPFGPGLVVGSGLALLPFTLPINLATEGPLPWR